MDSWASGWTPTFPFDHDELILQISDKHQEQHEVVAVHGIAGQIFRADSIFLWFSGTSGAKQSNFPRLIVSPLSQHFALAIRKTDIFTGVLGIIESGFSGTQVLKLSELVLRTNEPVLANHEF